MSNNSRLRFLVVLLLAAFTSATLVLADVGALGQNSNSSTTEGAAARSTEDISGEQVDLSGTYTGRVTTTGGHEMSGQATLTITGNTFTLESEGMTHSGRVYSVLTRGATSAAFYFSDVQDPSTNTPLVFNVRARKSGERLTLTPAPNTRNRMTFGTGAAPRGRRGRQREATSDNTSGSMDATTTGENANMGGENTNANTNTNAGTGRRRGRRRGTTNTNANANGNSNTGDNSNSTTPPR